MSMQRISALAFAIAIAMPGAWATAAGREGGAVTVRGVSAAPAAPAERGKLIRQFVKKWGAYIEQTYGLDVHVWAQRMVPQFATGDATNLRRALQRETLEGAMAELGGQGHRLSDEQAITMLAKASLTPSTQPNAVMAMALGDAEADLVYTPIQPCRIIDTRNTASGAIASNTSRDFFVWGASNYTSQGGSATDCGLAAESPAAAVLNIAAVLPAAAGYTTVYPYGATRPNAASINYAAGAIVNNSVIAKLAPGLPAFDVTIYTLYQADYVVDIVGYFSAPHATALDCTDVTQVLNIAAGQRGFAAPMCPAGYSLTGGGVRSADNDNQTMQASAPSEPDANEWFTSVLNSGGAAKDFTFTARCCRVPGR